jgi:arsenate reductase
MLELVGLNNCDSCRSARKWLDSQSIAYRFRDIREPPPTTQELKGWLAAVGADRLVNRRSTTWRQLSDTDRAKADGAQAAALLRANPTLIKRPVISVDNRVTVGFDAATKKTWQEATY